MQKNYVTSILSKQLAAQIEYQMNLILRIKKICQRIYFPHLLSILWTLVVLLLSLGKMPDDNKIRIPIPHLDKMVHFVMYFVYATLMLIEINYKTTTKKIIIVAYVLLFGSLMEIVQANLFTYRSGDIYDILFNTLGVGTALIFEKKIKWVIKT